MIGFILFIDDDSLIYDRLMELVIMFSDPSLAVSFFIILLINTSIFFYFFIW